MTTRFTAILILFTFLSTIGSGTVAARTLDRRGAIRAALEQNPQIAAARAEELAVEAQRGQVDAARWPIVTLDAGIGPSMDATLIPGTSVQSVQSQYANLRLADLSAVFLGNLTVIQPIYTFGKISYRQDAASHGKKAREAQTRMQRSDVAFEVARIYEGYLLARDGERFLKEIMRWLEKMLQSTEDKLAENVEGISDRHALRLQTALAAARMNLHRAEAGKAQARAGLAAFLGIPLGEEIAVTEPELAPVGQVPTEFSSLLTMAGEKRPELAALGEGQQALGALARAERMGLAPDVFAMAFLSAAYTPGRDWIQSRFVVDPLNHFVPGALLGLRWQFQGNTARMRAQEQNARADVLRHMERWARTGIPAEVRRAYEDVVRTTKDIEEGNVAVTKSKQWMVHAGADYSVGLGDLREVSDAAAMYVTLRGAAMQARFDHNVAMAALSKATGTLDGDSKLFYLAPGQDAGSTGNARTP